MIGYIKIIQINILIQTIRPTLDDYYILKIIIYNLKISRQSTQNPRVVGTAPQLTVVASPETAGRYFCKATSPGFTEIRAEALVLLKGAPRILSANEQYAASAAAVDEFGDSYDIECTAHSVPKAQHVSWTYNDKPINFAVDAAYSMREAYIANGVRSTLRVEENYRDFLGRYSCIVVNAYGSDSLDIVFRESSECLLKCSYLIMITKLFIISAILTKWEFLL